MKKWPLRYREKHEKNNEQQAKSKTFKRETTYESVALKARGKKIKMKIVRYVGLVTVSFCKVYMKADKRWKAKLYKYIRYA